MTRSAHVVFDENDSLADMLNDASIDRVMAIDLNWNVIAWNRNSELISGIHKNEILGKNLLELFPEILLDKEMILAIEAGFNGTKSFLPPNHTPCNRQYCENHFIPLKNKKGEVIGVMNIMHDVASRIKVEKQLHKLNVALEKKYQQLEKANKELATFTHITSKDIKEPLRQVYTSLELLVKREAPTLSNTSKGNLRRMQGTLNKINLLLDDILTVTGITCNDHEFCMVNLDDVCINAVTKLRKKIEEKNATISIGNLGEIRGNAKMLEILFVALIDNAIKFQPENGKPEVKINAESVSGTHSRLRHLSPDVTYLKINFTDNGIGFEMADAERLFLLFERLHDRKYHGSGIGLTICKKIADLHEGYISVVSSPGKGATFTCYLPVG